VAKNLSALSGVACKKRGAICPYLAAPNPAPKYGGQTRAVLEALLDKYADAGLSSVESLDILKVDPLRRFGTPIEIVNIFGGKEKYMAAVYELESQLYQGAA
jgi:type I restriction enzyme R subunit